MIFNFKINVFLIICVFLFFILFLLFVLIIVGSVQSMAHSNCHSLYVVMRTCLITSKIPRKRWWNKLTKKNITRNERRRKNHACNTPQLSFDLCSMWTRPIGIYDTILRNHWKKAMVFIIWHQKNQPFREILIKLYTEEQNAHTKKKNWWKQECGIKWQANMEIFSRYFYIWEKCGDVYW